MCVKGRRYVDVILDDGKHSDDVLMVKIRHHFSLSFKGTSKSENEEEGRRFSDDTSLQPSVLTCE